MIELAQKFIKCKNWRWMPGMVNLSPKGKFPERVIVGKHGLKTLGGCPVTDGGRSIPDLNDPATIGCLLIMVSDLAQKEKEATILEKLNTPPVVVFTAQMKPEKFAFKPVPTPVNDNLADALKEISVNGFTQPLRIGGLLLRALEAAE